MKYRHIHITGASGSGVSTLGHALADATGAVQLDTDDFYWIWPPDAPIYSVKRDVEERLRLMREAFRATENRGWILSGSVGDWAAPIIPLFDLVVFLYAPADLRIARLRAREKSGDAIERGGSRQAEIEEFIQWAADYDRGTRDGRNLAKHEEFLARMTCPVLRLDGSEPTDALVARTLRP